MKKINVILTVLVSVIILASCSNDVPAIVKEKMMFNQHLDSLKRNAKLDFGIDFAVTRKDVGELTLSFPEQKAWVIKVSMEGTIRLASYHFYPTTDSLEGFLYDMYIANSLEKKLKASAQKDSTIVAILSPLSEEQKQMRDSLMQSEYYKKSFANLFAGIASTKANHSSPRE